MICNSLVNGRRLLYRGCGWLATAIYYAAAFEAFFAKNVVHYGVVAMGVNADVATLFKGKLYGEVHDAFRLAVAGYAVYGGIRAIIEPLPIVYGIVGGVDAKAQHKSGYYLSVF